MKIKAQIDHENDLIALVEQGHICDNYTRAFYGNLSHNYADGEDYVSPITGRTYSSLTICEIGNDQTRKDNSGPHTWDQLCEMYSIHPQDREFIMEMYYLLK